LAAIGKFNSITNQTKFLCGIYTPAFSRHKVKQLPTFGILNNHPFLDVKYWVETKSLNGAGKNI